MKRAIYMAVALLLLAACDDVVDITPQPEPQPGPTPDEQVKVDVLNLTLKHSSKQLDAPVWYGEGVRGQVDWGDGTQEEYSDGLSHDYATDQTFNTIFEMERAKGFDIKRLGDIEHLTIEY